MGLVFLMPVYSFIFILNRSSILHKKSNKTILFTNVLVRRGRDKCINKRQRFEVCNSDVNVLNTIICLKFIRFTFLY